MKEKKDEYTWQQTDWDLSKELQDESKKLAVIFNSQSNCTHSIKFVDVTVYCVVDQGTGESGPKLNEYVLVEDFISGNFTKFCNNYGYISSESELMPAFMHWSWVHSKGQMMVADLQGVRNNLTYHLTDPALLSNTNSGRYGCTDTGVEGIAMFFLKHTCNQFCQGLAKPTIEDVVGREKHAALAQLEMIGTSTAYQHELKFPPRIRQTMITVFPQVATGSAYY